MIIKTEDVEMRAEVKVKAEAEAAAGAGAKAIKKKGKAHGRRRRWIALLLTAALLTVIVFSALLNTDRSVFYVDNGPAYVRVVILGRVYQIEKRPIEKAAAIYRSLIKKMGVFLPYFMGERVLQQS